MKITNSVFLIDDETMFNLINQKIIYIAKFSNTETQYIILQKKGTNPECFRDVVRHYHSKN